MSGQYIFHTLGSRQFEQLAATVLQEKYKIPVMSFSAGRDGGRDAAARGVSIKLGRGKLLHKQNIVIQAKHTKQESARMDDTIRNRLFQPEIKKVWLKLIKTYNVLP